MLRLGNRAEIQRLLPGGVGLGLSAGTEITALPRSDDGLTWNFQNIQGEMFAINHEQADAIIVRLISAN